MSNSPPSDDPDRYIKGILNKEEATLKEIYANCLPGVSNWIVKNGGSKVDAVDIFNESVVVIAEKIFDTPSFRPYTPFGAYLFGIARKLWYKKLNFDKNHQERVRNIEWEEYIGDAAFEEMIEKTLDGDRWTRLLERSFQRLTPLCQNLLTLYKNGTTVSEIAELLDMKENAVYQRRNVCSKNWRNFAKEDPDFNNYNPF